MDKSYIIKLVSEIIDKPLWDISIGLSGINIQIGKKSIYNNEILPSGEISIWLQCNTRISFEQKEFLFSHFPQDKKDTEKYKECFENKIATDAFIRDEDYSLHIKVKPDMILSAYPWTKESEKCWIIYDNRIQDPPGNVVYKDEVNKVQ